MSGLRPLHRLFGLSWIDFFQGTPITVKTELRLNILVSEPAYVLPR
jgi:hypothetical protein